MSLQPPQLQGYDFSKPDQARQYQYQMMLYLQSVQQQINLFTNQIGALNTFSLTPNSSQLGSIAVNTNFDCKSSFLSVVTFTMTAALTMTFSNLPLGALVLFGVTVGATARLLKLAASTPAAVAYTGIGFNYAGTFGTTINMLTTGQSISGGTEWAIGASYGTPAAPLLNFIGS